MRFSSFGFTTQQAGTVLDWIGTILTILLIAASIWYVL